MAMTSKGVAKEEFTQGKTSSALLKNLLECRTGLENAIGKLPLLADTSSASSNVHARYQKIHDAIGDYLQYTVVPEKVKESVKAVGAQEAEALKRATKQKAMDALNEHEKAFAKFAKSFTGKMGAGKSLSELNDALDDVAKSEEKLKLGGYWVFKGSPERKEKKAKTEAEKVNATLDRVEAQVNMLITETEILAMHRNMRTMLGSRNFRTEIADVAEHYHEHLLTEVPASLKNRGQGTSTAPQSASMPTLATNYAYTADFGKAWAENTATYLEEFKWAKDSFEKYTKGKKELKDAFDNKTLTEEQYLDLYKMLLKGWSDRNRELSGAFVDKIGGINNTKDAIRVGRMALQSFSMTDAITDRRNSGILTDKELEVLNKADGNDFVGDDAEWNKIYRKIKKISIEFGVAAPPTAHNTVGDNKPEWFEGTQEELEAIINSLPPPPPTVGATT
jgi:hypothetical protein